MGLLVGRPVARWHSALALLVLGALLSWSRAGSTTQPPGSWSERSPHAIADVRQGRPLVIVVVVPLCSSSQIDCGDHGLGNPGSLRTNLYWGALYGARRFFERPDRGYERVAVEAGRAGAAAPWLERAIYRRWLGGGPWGVADGDRVEQIVVLEGFHGDDIDAAVDHFFLLTAHGGMVTFQDGARLRTERIHVAGYAGHDRLMDGHVLHNQPSIMILQE